MPTIIPIRDLKNTSEISKLAHNKKEPIFITKNGYSDLVIMSIETFENYENTLQIDKTIAKVEEDIKKGDKGKPAKEVINKLNKKYYGKKARLQLLEDLAESEEDERNGRVAPIEDSFKELRKIVHES